MSVPRDGYSWLFFVAGLIWIVGAISWALWLYQAQHQVAVTPSYNVYHTPGACVYITGTTEPHIAVIPKTVLYSFGTFQGC
jgi:hypothetical protein